MNKSTDILLLYIAKAIIIPFYILHVTKVKNRKLINKFKKLFLE